jgi:hypothetical protein
MSLRTGSRRERAATRRARGAARACHKKHLRDVSVRGSFRAAIYGRLAGSWCPDCRWRGRGEGSSSMRFTNTLRATLVKLSARVKEYPQQFHSLAPGFFASDLAVTIPAISLSLCSR